MDLHMKEGTGKASYAQNSKIQLKGITNFRSILEESVQELIASKQPDCLMIADLGCASGPNALNVLSDIIHFVDIKCRSLNRQLPEFNLFLNDLPGNDFNTIFRLLPSLKEKLKERKGSEFEAAYYISGTPGSFYGRLFPSNFLHLVHSSYSLHWLSQVPAGLVDENGVALNKGSIHIARDSPPEVAEAYRKQFDNDFTSFLRCRARELVPGGRMVLILSGTTEKKETSIFWGLLSIALRNMVSEGLVDEGKLDAFNIPMYRASPEEVKMLIEREGSFALYHLDSLTMKWEDPKLLADGIRAISEPLLVDQFGEAIMEDLFERYKELFKNHMKSQEVESYNLIISMLKK